MEMEQWLQTSGTGAYPSRSQLGYRSAGSVPFRWAAGAQARRCWDYEVAVGSHRGVG